MRGIARLAIPLTVRLFYQEKLREGKQNLSASFSGTDDNEFNIRDKERDNSGKEHQFVFSVVKRKNNNINCYVRCIGDGVVLTPERLLSLTVLVEEYNWDWALAAFDGEPQPHQ